VGQGSQSVRYRLAAQQSRLKNIVVCIDPPVASGYLSSRMAGGYLSDDRARLVGAVPTGVRVTSGPG